jgi:hypothetical protein
MDAAGVLAPWNLAFGVTWTPTKPSFTLQVTRAAATNANMSDCWVYRVGGGSRGWSGQLLLSDMVGTTDQLDLRHMFSIK